MNVKDLLAQLANCPPETTVNVAVTDRVEIKMYPATSLQILTQNFEGKETKALMIITNTKNK